MDPHNQPLKQTVGGDRFGQRNGLAALREREDDLQTAAILSHDSLILAQVLEAKEENE